MVDLSCKIHLDPLCNGGTFLLLCFFGKNELILPKSRTISVNSCIPKGPLGLVKVFELL